jgi:molybdate transport system substrate-binding protein
MSAAIRVVSSMATRKLLADLAVAFQATSGGQLVTVESIGGVEAARRVAAGEPFDAVVLASGPIDTLTEQGHLAAGSRVDLVQSPMAIAIRSGLRHPRVRLDTPPAPAATTCSPSFSDGTSPRR